MTSSQQSWFEPGLRFFGSCFVSLLYWAVWLGLSATLATLIYILVAKEMPVPDFILRRVEARLAEANFTIKFGTARFDTTGKILLKEVELRSRQFNEPLLTSRLVYFRRNFWSILAGRPIPDEIRLEGATLQLPAMLSPSGAAAPVVRDLATVLRNDGDNEWHVDQLTCRLGKLKITAEGDIGVPQKKPGTKSASPEEITSQFLKIGRQLILQINQLEAFDEPALDIHLENQTGVATIANCVFTADSVHQPWAQPLISGPMVATTTLRFDGRDEHTVRLYASTDHIKHGYQYVLETVKAIVSARVTSTNFSIQPIEGWFAAGWLSVDYERVVAPLGHADFRNWPAVKISTAAQIGGGILMVEADANLTQQSARIAIDGNGSPEVINRVLGKHLPRAAPYFIFYDPVNASAEAVLSAGWHFEKLSSRVVAGRINSRDVNITAARGRIEIVGMNFLAYDARVEMGDNIARGSYWMNFITTDYRMLLKGRLRPPEISGWFSGDWWSDFWNEHFDFPTMLPEGDVDVQGRWKDVTRTEYFGRAQAAESSVWGGKFDQVQAVVFLRPFFTHVIEFNGVRAHGAQKLSGSLKRFSKTRETEAERLEFDFDGNIDPETYHGLLEGKADEVLQALQFTAPPHVHAQGGVEGQGLQTKPDYTFTGLAEGGLRYYGFPLESVRVKGGVKGTDVHLEDIQFAAIGGKGAGKAALTGPPQARKLGFDLYLNSADLPQAIRAVQEYQISNKEQKRDPVKDSSLIKRASGGRLDIALSAQGSPGSLVSFIGTGNAAVNGANLGEIQLFGLLSQVLSGLSLNFSSLKLDSAHTSFRLESGRLHFPDLKITGPSAAIEARGDFVFENNILDFTAKFKPFEESRNLLTAAIGVVINPITSILELKLTGPLNKPNWSIDVGSSSPRHEIPVPKEKGSDPIPAVR